MPNSKKRKKSSPLHTVWNACSALVTILLIAFLLLQLAALASNNGWSVLGYRAYVMESGGMGSALPKGSFTLAKDISPEDVAEGDIITYNTAETVAVSRVAAVSRAGGARLFTTKSDGAPTEDAYPTPGGSVIGKVIWHMPEIGLLMMKLHEPQMMITLLAVLAVLLVVPSFFKRRTA